MFLSRGIGIDLGTANSLIFVKGKGIVLREPSVVAVNDTTGKVQAVGNEAKSMIGRTPGNIRTLRPLKDGVIADFDVTADMLKYFIRKVVHGGFFSRPRVVICIPSGVTEVERRAVEDAAKLAGAGEVVLIEEPMAAAIGAGLPVFDATGNMIVDIGGGTAEVAVISFSGIVTAKSVRVAGDELTESIINYIKKKYSLLIGERTAEDIKIRIGSAYPVADEDMKLRVSTAMPVESDGKKVIIGDAFGSSNEPEVVMKISGRDLVSGLPNTIVITMPEVREALSEPLSVIIDAIKSTLEATPPELSSDIIDRGITLTGGGALLTGLDKLIEKETGIHVNIAPNPLDCVAEGTGRVVNEPQNFTELPQRRMK